MHNTYPWFGSILRHRSERFESSMNGLPYVLARGAFVMPTRRFGIAVMVDGYVSKGRMSDMTETIFLVKEETMTDDIRDGDLLRVTYKSGAILTGPAVLRDDGMLAVRLNEGCSVLVARDYDGTLPPDVVSVSRVDSSPLPLPDRPGLWRDGYGGLIVVEDDGDGGLLFTRVNQAGDWEVDGPLPDGVIVNLAPFARVDVTGGAPVWLTATPTTDQTEAAAREITRTLYDTGDVDSLKPDEAYWVRFAALHALQAAAEVEA